MEKPSNVDWWKPFKDYDGKYQMFMLWNAVAGVAHLGNAIATIAQFSTSDDVKYPMYQLYSDWSNKTGYCAENGKGTFTDVFEFSNSDDEVLIVDPSNVEKRYTLSLLLLIFFFHLLSAAFQLSVGCFFGRSYSKSVLRDGVNVWRFVEYSISASLMLLCLALIQYVQDVYTHIGLGVLTAATMLFGLIAEMLFSDSFVETRKVSQASSVQAEEVGSLQLIGRANFVNEVGLRKRSLWPNDSGDAYLSNIRSNMPKQEMYVQLRKIGWCAHFSGWLTMMAAYIGILMNHFYWSVEQSDRKAPDFVEPLLWGIFALYNIFGVTQLFQMCAKDPWVSACTGVKSKTQRCLCADRGEKNSDSGREIICNCCFRKMSLNTGVELFYVLNSLTTKTILGWVIISQLIMRQNIEIKQIVECK